jgi:hypothetical protein
MTVVVERTLIAAVVRAVAVGVSSERSNASPMGGDRYPGPVRHAGRDP